MNLTAQVSERICGCVGQAWQQARGLPTRQFRAAGDGIRSYCMQTRTVPASDCVTRNADLPCWVREAVKFGPYDISIPALWDLAIVRLRRSTGQERSSFAIEGPRDIGEPVMIYLRSSS